MIVWVIGGFGAIGSELVLSLDCDDNEIFVSGRGDTVERRFFCFKSLCRQVELIPRQFFYRDYVSSVHVCLYLACSIVPSTELNDEQFSKMVDTELSDISEATSLLNTEESQFVYFSSGGAIYDDTMPNRFIPYDELAPVRPRSRYGMLKLQVEEHLRSEPSGPVSRILRLTNPYGISRRNSLQQGVISIFKERILNQQPIYIFGDGNNERDYIHIEDVNRAVHKVLTYKGTARVFNIGTGVGTTLNELLSLIQYELGVQAQIERLPLRECDMKYAVTDNSVAYKELQWAPQISLETGIRRVMRGS